MPSGNGSFGGPPLIIRTAIILFAVVAMVGLGLIANGLYDKAKAGLFDDAPHRPLTKHAIHTTVGIDPAPPQPDATSPLFI